MVKYLNGIPFNSPMVSHDRLWQPREIKLHVLFAISSLFSNTVYKIPKTKLFTFHHEWGRNW